MLCIPRDPVILLACRLVHHSLVVCLEDKENGQVLLGSWWSLQAFSSLMNQLQDWMLLLLNLWYRFFTSKCWGWLSQFKCTLPVGYTVSMQAEKRCSLQNPGLKVAKWKWQPRNVCNDISFNKYTYLLLKLIDIDIFAWLPPSFFTQHFKGCTLYCFGLFGFQFFLYFICSKAHHKLALWLVFYP